MVERVLLIRHGETDWNAAGRWQGFEQIPLNAQGLGQARALASYLRERPIQALCTSDLSRAFQTASAVGDSLGIAPQVDERWRELNLGIFQGLTMSDIESQYPDELVAWRANYMGYKVPGGESRLEMQGRAYQAWLEISSQPEGPEVAIVSHGGTIKLLLMKLFENDGAMIRNMHIANTSITILEHQPHSSSSPWRLSEFAITPHLISDTLEEDKKDESHTI